MKRKSTLILILSVAAVWGMIFYRLFSASQERGESYKPALVSSSKSEDLEDYRLKHLGKLVLDYPDPFLKDKISEGIAGDNPEKAIETVIQDQSKVIPVKVPIDWNKIRYMAFVQNPHTKRTVSILSVSGKEFMLSEGETAEGVKLIRNRRDSVLISFGQSQRFLKLQ